MDFTRTASSVGAGSLASLGAQHLSPTVAPEETTAEGMFEIVTDVSCYCQFVNSCADYRLKKKMFNYLCRSWRWFEYLSV